MFLSALLLLPVLAFGEAFPATLVQPSNRVHVNSPGEQRIQGRVEPSARAADWNGSDPGVSVPVARQVRIEHRVIVRVVPYGRQRSDSVTALPVSVPLRIVERPIAGCVPVNQIAGVSADRGDRLRLHMRSRQVLSVRFGDACRTEAFYSGFFIERRKDGLLCPARDAIHSRSGMRCTVGRISQLMAERAD